MPVRRHPWGSSWRAVGRIMECIAEYDSVSIAVEPLPCASVCADRRVVQATHSAVEPAVPWQCE